MLYSIWGEKSCKMPQVEKEIILKLVSLNENRIRWLLVSVWVLGEKISSYWYCGLSADY